jgi:hypothetical protein
MITKKTGKILLAIQLLEVFQGRRAECLQSRSIEYKYVWWFNFHIRPQIAINYNNW